MINYEKNAVLIENAINEEHFELALENMVLDFSKKGESKKDIYEFLHNYYLKERDTQKYLKFEKDYGDHPVELTMDRLWGWYHKDAILLPNESINE
jgi:hypothetical protein